MNLCAAKHTPESFGEHRQKSVSSDFLLLFLCTEIFILHGFYVGSNTNLSLGYNVFQSSQC